jgi:hypothetical protein
MRNYRKNRKHGGIQFVDNIFTCSPVKGRVSVTTKVERCAKEFADSQGLQIIETADDGNCFYDSLSKYGSRTGNPATNKSHLVLRREIVGAMIRDQAEYAPFFVPNDPNAAVPSNDDIREQLKSYLRPYQWSGPLGDIFPQVAAKVLNINITIYDVRNNGTVSMIAMGNGPGGIPNPALPVVSLLRTNGNHFRLLVPKVEPKNVVGNVANKLAKATLNNKSRARSRSRSRSAPRKKSPSPKPVAANRVGYSLRSRATNKKPAVGGPGRSPSPVEAAKRITRRKPKVAPLVKNSNAEVVPVETVVKKAPASRRKPKVAYENNNYAKQLQAAIAESLKESKKPLGNNFFNALQAASFENVK